MEKLFPSLDSPDIITNLDHRAAYLIIPSLVLIVMGVKKFIKWARSEYKSATISDGSRGGCL